MRGWAFPLEPFPGVGGGGCCSLSEGPQSRHLSSVAQIEEKTGVGGRELLGSAWLPGGKQHLEAHGPGLRSQTESAAGVPGASPTGVGWLPAGPWPLLAHTRGRAPVHAQSRGEADGT